MTYTSHSARRTTYACAYLALALALAACSQSAAPQAQEGLPGSVYDGTDRSWTAQDGGLGAVQPQAIVAGDNILSNEAWMSATNGWGPAERNTSNGESGLADGRPLSLAGKTYTYGLGVHASSTIAFAVGGKCSTFTADVGVDDEVGDRGSVVFQVYGDGVKLYDSGVMTGASATKSVSVDIAGRSELKLVVTDAGDNNYYDHADWANAMVRSCSTTASAPTPAPAAPTVQYGGPITITRGGTYSGNWQSLDPNVPAVRIETREPVVIENANIRGRGDLIRGYWVNLTVRNSRGYGMNPNVYGSFAGRFVSVEDVVSLNVENNYLEGTSGIYVNIFQGRAGSQTVKVLRNRVKNIDGRRSNGNNGYIDDRYRVQFVQMSKIRNLPGVEIAWNEVINEPGKSSLEENINFYSSSGTASSPILVHNNYIQGAYAVNPATDGAYSGGGIMLGDGDIANLDVAGGFVNVYKNQVVSTSNQGIGIAGGHDHNVYDNRIVSSGRLPDGAWVAAQNVGVYVWDVLGGSRTGVWFNNSMRDNVIGWNRQGSNGTTWQNNTWFANCTNLCYNNQAWPTPVTLDTERQELALWQSKYQSAGVSVGPR